MKFAPASEQLFWMVPEGFPIAVGASMNSVAPIRQFPTWWGFSARPCYPVLLKTHFGPGMLLFPDPAGGRVLTFMRLRGSGARIPNARRAYIGRPNLRYALLRLTLDRGHCEYVVKEQTPDWMYPHPDRLSVRQPAVAAACSPTPEPARPFAVRHRKAPRDDDRVSRRVLLLEASSLRPPLPRVLTGPPPAAAWPRFPAP